MIGGVAGSGLFIYEENVKGKSRRGKLGHSIEDSRRPNRSLPLTDTAEIGVEFLL